MVAINSQLRSIMEKLANTTKNYLGPAVFVLGIALLIYNYSLENEINGVYLSFGLMLIGSLLATFHSWKQLIPVSTYVKSLNAYHWSGLFLSLVGVAFILLTWFTDLQFNSSIFWTSLLSLSSGILLFTYGAYKDHPSGIKNNHTWHNSLTNRGIIGWSVGILLTVFYIHLYVSKDALNGLALFFDPLSEVLRGKPSDKWFVYGSLYTLVILFLGIKFIVKYWHNKYQFYRTLSVIFSQLVFAYFLPQIIEAFNYDNVTAVVDGKSQYLGYYSANPVYTWPLNYSFFQPQYLKAYAQEAYQPVAQLYFLWGLLMFLIVTPLLTYWVGKRWYCSWICGCGGLAETAGDSFRHLSSKKVSTWQIERWVIHTVMVFTLIMTLAVLMPFFTGYEYTIGLFNIDKFEFAIFTSVILFVSVVGLILLYRKFRHKFLLLGIIITVLLIFFFILGITNETNDAFFISSKKLKSVYGFFIGTSFSGVIGVGFYPILGNRVWCRFGCPMAGYMGIFQRFKSRFRITTNGGQCISCGNCSTYCEQGIDVRAYAQKGENIVRSSCVGCGICSAVCPRGVLKLENGPEEGRITDKPIEVTKDGIRLNL